LYYSIVFDEHTSAGWSFSLFYGLIGQTHHLGWPAGSLVRSRSVVITALFYPYPRTTASLLNGSSRVGEGRLRATQNLKTTHNNSTPKKKNNK
jgi:hypothetical protein